ncbi:MAG TPA: MOSC N-terminal beta barrel domain-containing protein [Polyangiaceae bacterium]|nr:MOSC N-terminal beta barrel domain-containing protein [Polyangiaceae bacterium]
MRLVEIWRHPVKSMQGERLTEAALLETGLEGDRAWGLRDADSGNVLTGRREPRLLHATARFQEAPVVTLPDGRVLRGLSPENDTAYCEWLGRTVSLVAAADVDAHRAEFFADPTDDDSDTREWTMPAGRFVDAFAILVLTTASLRAGRREYPQGAWDARRFRPNLLVDASDEGWIEDAWCGRVLRVGDVELEAREKCVRCTMVTRAQPGLERDVEIFRTLAKHHDAYAGVWCSVRKAGRVREGDAVSLEL